MIYSWNFGDVNYDYDFSVVEDEKVEVMEADRIRSALSAEECLNYFS